MKVLGNGVVFVSLYILFMIPTYLLPYLGSNSSIVGAVGAASGAGIAPQTIMHLLALAALIIVTWFRGTLVQKKWLVVFPIIASIFDMVPGLNWIPLIPTVMHIIVLIKGVSEQGVQESALKD